MGGAPPAVQAPPTSTNSAAESRESGLFGSAGACGWSGGYNTYFRIDPKEDLIFMLFVQPAYVPADQELQFTFHNTVMQALVD